MKHPHVCIFCTKRMTCTTLGCRSDELSVCTSCSTILRKGREVYFVVKARKRCINIRALGLG